jgi:hypothetical protein
MRIRRSPCSRDQIYTGFKGRLRCDNLSCQTDSILQEIRFRIRQTQTWKDRGHSGFDPEASRLKPVRDEIIVRWFLPMGQASSLACNELAGHKRVFPWASHGKHDAAPKLPGEWRRSPHRTRRDQVSRSQSSASRPEHYRRCEDRRGWRRQIGLAC